jgi:L-threonate 2-dehydrogenase
MINSTSASKLNNTIGIFGLGIMGLAIAEHLIAHGWTVVGYDPDPLQQKKASTSGVRLKSQAIDVVSEADIILSSLPNQQALDQSIDAIVNSEKSQVSILADLSTLKLECKLSNIDRLKRAGVTFLDCPISGTGAQAQTADISIYASGCSTTYDFCKPLLQDFANHLHYLGKFGNGTKMKFVANLLVAIHNVATAEAMLLGKGCGLDPQEICDTIATGAGSSKIFELRAPLMVEQEFDPPTMRLDLWKKDMELISDFIKESGVSTPLFKATSSIYDAANEHGLGKQDTAAIYTIMDQLSDGA